MFKMSLHDKLLIRKKVIIESMNDELKILRQFGIKHSRYAFCCVALVGEKPFLTCPILFRGHGYLSPTCQFTIPSLAFSLFWRGVF